MPSPTPPRTDAAVEPQDVVDRPLILVVDDLCDTGQIYRVVLNRNAFSVVKAADGKDGVVRAVLHRPDLILMDLQMPVMDGWTAMHRLREEESTARTPVIAVTGHPVDGDRWRAAGSSAFLPKPFRGRQLVEAIRTVLSFPSQAGVPDRARAAGDGAQEVGAGIPAEPVHPP